MDASELRFGNLLYYKEDVVTLCGINPSECFVIRDKDLVMTGIDNLKPIPLTEEWLLKFGFIEKDFEDEEFATSYYDYNSFLLDLSFQPTGSLYVGISYELKYVHQLQNLYFALTGDELQLK